MGRITTFTIIIKTDAAGNSSKAVCKRLGTVPAIAPMMGALMARPIQPLVITMPMAVAVALGNASPTMASVVGKTGAMARQPQNTATAATATSDVWMATSVVMLIS